jgi:hypothetical protein
VVSDGKGSWECWDSNDPSFRILDDGWLFRISKGDTGGAALSFDEAAFDGYGVTYDFDTFRIQGDYDVDAQGSLSGTFTINNLEGVVGPVSGNLTGSLNLNATKMTLKLKDSSEEPVFNMTGVRLLSEPDILGSWSAAISGDATGSFNPLTIDSFQDGGEAVSHVFRILWSGNGSVNIQGNFFFTPATKTDSNGRIIGNVVYGVYEMTGGETGVFSGAINPKKGRFTFNLTSNNGNKYRLIGKR